MSEVYLAPSRLSKNERIYAAARQFAEECLIGDGSLFTPGQPIWTPEAIADIHDRVVANYDPAPESFVNKLVRQLEGANTTAVQLSIELMYVYFLTPNNMSGSSKRSRITELARAVGSDLTIPETLAVAFDHGVANPGSGMSRRWYQIAFLVNLALEIKRLSSDSRRTALSDPSAFKSFAMSIPAKGAEMQRQTLLHLFFPQTFEPIISIYDKRDIASRFSDLVDPDATDLDQQIADIRLRLSETYGPGFGFYDEEVRQSWQRGSDPWDEFIYWAKRFHDLEEFDVWERDYKLRAAEMIAEAKEAFLRGDDWQTPLKRALTSSKHNLVSWRAYQRFLSWVSAKPDDARQALAVLWDSGGADDRVGEFLALLPASKDGLPGLGARLSILSFLMMAVDPYRYPPYRSTVYEAGYRLTGYPPPPDDHAGAYSHALGFLDRVMDEAAQRDFGLRDRLDAQSVLWKVSSSGVEDSPIADWPVSEQRRFRRFRGEPIDDTDDDLTLLPSDEAGATDPYATLADELLLPVSFLRDVRRLLADKRQVIFYGPPGTGKTFVAQKLAERFAGDLARVGLVQFHPSYAYEDFVQGYRPAKDGGFVLRDGPLIRIAERARSEPDQKHVLVIDEINRGNVAKLFGELYFLLEYRDREINLQYADEPFRLPSNLWIIGTMNTADRSIALIDAALRRRFYFVEFFPSRPPIQDLLRRWLARHKPDMACVADYVDRANAMLGDRDAAIGPSHFMKPNLDDEWLELIWEHSVLPYVAEHYFGQEDRVSEFKLDAIRGREVDDAVDDATPDAG